MIFIKQARLYCFSHDFQVKTHCLTDVMKEPVYLGMQYPSGKADSANCTELHNGVIEDAACLR